MLILVVVAVAIVAVIVLVARDVDRKERRHDQFHGGLLTGRSRRRRWPR